MWVAQLRRMPAKIRMCARVHAPSYVYVRSRSRSCIYVYMYMCASAYMHMCANAHEGPLSPSVFRRVYLTDSLGPFHPFPFPALSRNAPFLSPSFPLFLFLFFSLSISFCLSSLAVHFFLMSADEDRSLARRRERTRSGE